jgi:hypothetical protein
MVLSICAQSLTSRVPNFFQTITVFERGCRYRDYGGRECTSRAKSEVETIDWKLSLTTGKARTARQLA